MSEHMVTFTSIEAALKSGGVKLTAYGPDETEKTVFVPSEDIKTLYNTTAAAFVNDFEADQNTLFGLFHAVAGISVSY